jgi:transposase-like protein
VIIAVGVNTDGRREVLGMMIGASEAETFWTEFLRQLVRRGLPFAAYWPRRLRRSDQRPPGH